MRLDCHFLAYSTITKEHECSFLGVVVPFRQTPGMGFFAWYASASSATATQFKNLRAVPKICVHCKGEVLSAVLFYGVS